MLINSPAERQIRIEHKRRKLLRFLRDETWSSLPVMASLLVMTEPAMYKTLCQMERDGFIVRHKVESFRISLWGITTKGLLWAWDADEKMLPRPYFEPGKLATVTIQHNLDTQTARLQAEQSGWSEWIPGNRLPPEIKKRPDAIAQSPWGEQVAIEIERSIKTQKRYESIFSLYLQAIKRGELDKVHYVCPDAEFALRMRRMFTLIDTVPAVGERVPLTDRHRARFPVFALESWPPAAP